MGIGPSTQMIGDQPPPEKLSDFKKLAAAPEQFNIPEIPSKRQPTDAVFFYVFVACLLLLFSFLIYTGCNSYDPIYDQCGNVCGEDNDFVDSVNCSGKDMTKLPYSHIDVDISRWEGKLDYNYLPRHCVESCGKAGYIIVENVCFPLTIMQDFNISDEKVSLDIDDQYNKFWKHVTHSLGSIIFLTAISIALCMAMMLLFRYATAAMIWIIIVGCYVMLVLTTIILWFFGDSTDDTEKPNEPVDGDTGVYINKTSRDSDSGFAIALTLTIITIIVTFALYRSFKRIPLVINLFREAVKAIFAMPMIILEPLLTGLSLFIALMMFVITTIVAVNAGSLTELKEGFYTYQPNGAIIFTFLLSVVMFIWMVTFIIGCQTVVIAGAISAWYFARDKTFMGSPIKDSFMILLKFHLGSVAFGSLILTLAEIVKCIMNSMARSKFTKALVNYCLNIFQSLLAYISNNAYIEVAMHGEGFFKSGRRALRLLYNNLLDVLVVNSIGDFVLFMSKLFVVVTTIIIATLIKDRSSPEFNVVLLSGALISVFVAHAVFKVFETAIDTIFLCYCEDCLINDGGERPYYMSIELMQFFDESKAVLATKTAQL